MRPRLLATGQSQTPAGGLRRPVRPDEDYGNQKRGLPRSALSDNGAAMTAAEITQGLTRLGILHQTTLPYSPYQNAKQEAFWGPVEGRLIAMLEDVPDLTLPILNEATQAWDCASAGNGASASRSLLVRERGSKHGHTSLC